MIGNTHDFDKRLEFLTALLTPAPSGKPRSLKEVCKQVGLPHKTGEEWKRRLRTEPKEFLNIVDGPPDEVIRKLLADNAALRKRLSEAEDFERVLKIRLEDIVSPLKTNPALYRKPDRKKRGADSLVAMVDVSDIHIGSLVDAKDSLGLSEYSVDVFHSRLERWENSLLEVVEKVRSFATVDRLIVNAMGDWLDSFGVFAGQAYEQDLDPERQVMVAVTKLGASLERICREFSEVTIYGVPGNHGPHGRRSQAGRKFKTDRIVYWFIIDHMLRDVPNLHRSPLADGLKPYAVFPQNETTQQIHCIIHGDQVRGWMSLPYYGSGRAAGRVMGLLGRSDLVALHIGHHHQLANISGGVTDIIHNGSWVGGSTYSINDLFLSDIAKQQMMFIDEQLGIVMQHPLLLSDPVRLVVDTNGELVPEGTRGVNG